MQFQRHQLHLSIPRTGFQVTVGSTNVFNERRSADAAELPLGFGYVEGSKAARTTTSATAPTTLFAALNVLNGAALACCKPRHRDQKFFSFLRQFDAAVPADLDIHCIVDNDATRRHPRVRAWLASAARDPDLQLLAQSG